MSHIENLYHPVLFIGKVREPTDRIVCCSLLSCLLIPVVTYFSFLNNCYCGEALYTDIKLDCFLALNSFLFKSTESHNLSDCHSKHYDNNRLQDWKDFVGLPSTCFLLSQLTNRTNYFWQNYLHRFYRPIYMTLFNRTRISSEWFIQLHKYILVHL